MPFIETIATPIAVEARDLLPETWNALAGESTFGPAALERRHNRVVKRIFGTVLTDEEQDIFEDLDGRLIEYAGKKLAFALIDPGIEYWSKQLLSTGVLDRETSSYKDRAEDLRELREKWMIDLVALESEIDPLLPIISRPAKDSPLVVQAGDTVAHVTPNPLEIEPAWLPPEV